MITVGQFLESCDWDVEWEDDEVNNGHIDGSYIALGDLNAGDLFLIGDDEFIVVDESTDSLHLGIRAVLKKEFLPNRMTFGDTSDWKGSQIRSYLNNEYYDEIKTLVGQHNIVSMQRDLTSLDGLDDYGFCDDNISLLSASEYARYHQTIGVNQEYPCAWWTITPLTTPSNGYARSVCYVYSNGILDWRVGGYSYGVRPFFNLLSSTLVKPVSNRRN